MVIFNSYVKLPEGNVHVESMMIMADIGLIPLLVCPPWKTAQSHGEHVRSPSPKQQRTFTEATKKGSQQNDSLISLGL